MSTLNIIRAWKDEEYRSSLGEADLAALPEHPAGLVELADGALDEAAGGWVITDAYVCFSLHCSQLPQCHPGPVLQ